MSGNTNIGQFPGPQINVKQEPIMSVGNKGQNFKRPNKYQFRKKTNEQRNTKFRPEQKQCTKYGRTFSEGYLKTVWQWERLAKTNKPNHLAKKCRWQQVNEVTEGISSSEEKCNLIHSSDSCDEFEIMAIETKPQSVTQDIWNIDIRRNPQSHQIKALKALVRVNNQIINLAIDTGSPTSFLNWTTAKQLLDGSSETKFIPAGKLNLSAQFVDYNNHPALILGAIRASICSAGWEVKNASLLITERRARCILGLDLQGKMGIHTSRRPAPSKRSRFDVLLCEQSEGMKQQFYQKFSSQFDRQGKSKNHVVNTKFKYPLCPIQEKGRRTPIHMQDKVQAELSKLLSKGHITKLDKCTSDCFIAPIVITVIKDDSIKLALDAKPINRQMPNVDELLDGVSQIVTTKTTGTLSFTVLDLKYAYSQIKLTAETAKQCSL